ncbi:MAG: LPS assembly lipoprotein LptE [Alphaproteobacteria bacterium]|nr:LPS assembly lipoprotein LptE [Alphaproteobacteria bacterium]
MFKLIPILFSLFFLATCGFEPLHIQKQNTIKLSVFLNRIHVLPIPERTGQLLRINLTNQLNPKGPSDENDYILSVILSEKKRDLGVRRDATATRTDLIITAEYVLKDIKKGAAIISGTVKSVTSYNILDADFANRSAEEDARRRASLHLSTEISTRLKIFFHEKSP